MWRTFGFWARSQKYEMLPLVAACLSLRLSVHMEQLGSHLTDFHEIWYLNTFINSFGNIQIKLKSDKNNEHIT
jgi:hypothetical protein